MNILTKILDISFPFMENIKQGLSVIRFKPFDCASLEGRSKERYRRMALTSLFSAVARSVGMLTSLISVPLTVHYLGPERYGMWMTASSVIALLGFADFGMGNGLVNAISESDGKDDHKAAQIYVSSAFYMLLGISGLILCLLALVYLFIPWPRLFNVISDLAMREAGPSMAVFVVLLALNMPLGVAQRVQMGYQEGFKSHLWGVLGNLLGLGGVLIAIYVKAGLPWLVLAMSGGPTFAMLLNWLDLFYRSRTWLCPCWNAFNWSAGRKVAGTGVFFMILQLMTLIGFSSDNLVIAQVLGASTVSMYALTQKLFVTTMLTQYFTMPLWPAFGEALARNDFAWARRTLNRALKLSFAASAATALPLFMFAKQIISYWVGPEMVPSTLLLAGFALFVFLTGYVGTMSTVLNNGHLVKKQALFFSAASLTALMLKVILAYGWGIEGVVWATVLGYGLFYVMPALRLSYQSVQAHSDDARFQAQVIQQYVTPNEAK